jgi:hypothetical protein
VAWTIDTAFDQFHVTISLLGDHRAAANTRKDWLLGQLRPRLQVVDAFAFGSITKQTALSGHADVDILVQLHYGAHIKDRKPSAVLLTLKTALGPGAGEVRRNGQAVTVRFKSWPNIDVVPACGIRDSDGKTVSYEIPDMRREVWLDTDPKAHARRITAAASVRGPNFRRVIKMMKDWNRRQPKRLQSYHVEVIAIDTSSDWDDLGWSLLQFCRTARAQLGFHWYDGSDVTGYIDWATRPVLDSQLAQAESLALTGWLATYNGRSDHQTAITTFKRMFGLRFPSYG